MPYELESLADDQAVVLTPEGKKITVAKTGVAPKTWESITTLQGRIKPLAEETSPSAKFGQVKETREEMQRKTLEPAVKEQLINQAPTEPPKEQAPPVVVVQQPAPQPQIVTPTVTQATSTQKVETRMGKEQKAAYEAEIKANQAYAVAAEEETKLTIEKANRTNLERQQLATQNVEEAAKLENTYRERQAELAKQESKIRASQEELKNYKFKEFFEGREGARVMAGISVALGAVGASFTKGPNYAMQIIENAIQNDLALQKANYDKLKGSVEADQSLYGQLVRKLGDELAAGQQFLNIRNNAVSQKIDASAAMVSDEEGKAKLASLKAQIDQKAAQAMVDATKGLDVKVITETKPMVVPTAKETAQAGREIEEYVAKTPIKEAMDSYAGAQEFKAAVAAGATPQAIAAFIAGPKGLGQGSYGPNFDQMLRNAGLVDRSIEKMTEFFQGEKSATLVKSIQGFLDARSVEAASRARDYLPEFERLNQRAGRPIDLYTRQVNPAGLVRSKAAAAGLKPVKKAGE